MCRFLIVFVLVISTMPALSQQGIQVNQVSLIRATNYIQNLRVRPGEVSNQEVVVATSKACSGLQDIAKDAVFRDRVTTTAAGRKDHEEKVTQVNAQLVVFINEFLTPEISLLQRAGLDSATVVQITKDAIDLKRQYPFGKSGSVDVFFGNLEKFTLEVCAAAHQARVIQARSDKEALERLAYGLSGTAMILIDTALVAPTESLSFLSYDFGFQLFLKALPR